MGGRVVGLHRSGRLSVSHCFEGVPYHAKIASLQLMKRAPSSASAAEDITALMIWEMMTKAPLLAGMGELLDMKKCPLSRLLVFDSER